VSILHHASFQFDYYLKQTIMANFKNSTIVAIMVMMIMACSQPAKENKVGISKVDFEKVIDGKQVSLWTLSNANGLEMTVTNYGGKVVSLLVPDKNKKLVDVVTGYKTLAEYEKSKEIYFGAAIGRFGNRIAKGKFVLDSVEYTLAANNGENHLHGGPKGFHNVVWDAEQTDASTLVLSYLAADGEEGYPGNLMVKMTYKLTEDNAFQINYEATTDKATIANITHHTYFNLNGEGNGSINNHELFIDADSYTPTDAGLIPTGVIEPVEGTPMDFRTPIAIGERVDADFEALKLGKGYDHNYVLNNQGQGIRLVASLYAPTTGIVMDILSEQPAIQFYGGNFMDGTEIGKSRKPYGFREGLCLETQHYPDSPNQPSFPSTVLRPGETYTHTCIYKFSIKE
jgi:aldose 1-epimerase